ncbi:MAG: PIN domain-containing protein [Candidatus Vogelbacteria bacterium]|nr:PIN domain-containing protein [Candidatus Vogelbacteria bacterium]
MTLDTNILIAYLNGESKVVDFILEQKAYGRALFVSAVSAAELLSLAELTEGDLRRIRDFLDNFISVPFDRELAETVAFIRRLYQLSIADAAVVAAALSRQMPLVSRDRGIRKVKEVVFVDL